MINVIIQLYIFTGLGLLACCFFAGAKNNLSVEKPYCNWQKTLGESFFIGVFFIVLISNLLQLFDLQVSQNLLWYLALFWSTVSFVIFIFYKKDYIINRFKINFKFNGYLLFFTIIIIFHLYYIISQSQDLPLTAWDAWIGWIAKAKIWSYHGINETIVQRHEWVLSDHNFTNLTAHYPDALPLLYVFNSAYYGWNEVALNAIYPAMFIAFLLAFFGNIKQLINIRYAYIAVFILVTIPFVNVHITLAGYADIWIAVYLMLCIFNVQHFLSKPSWRKFLLITSLVITMLMFKLIAWVWVLMLVIVFTLCLISPAKRKWVYLLVFVVVVIWYVTGGFHLRLPFGELVISPSSIKIPTLDVFELSFFDTTFAWVETLFLSNNWNLLWYSIPIVIFLFMKLPIKNAVALPAMYLVFTLLFLFVLFYMTYNGVFANDFTSSNRVVLHIVPVYIYFILQVFYQYQQQNKNSPKLNNANGFKQINGKILENVRPESKK